MTSLRDTDTIDKLILNVSVPSTSLSQVIGTLKTFLLLPELNVVIIVVESKSTSEPRKDYWQVTVTHQVACIHIHTHTCMHACAHARMHACTHARTHARTHTHAFTSKVLLIRLSLFWGNLILVTMFVERHYV